VTIEQADADIARMLPVWANSFPAPPGYSTKIVDDARISPNLRPFKQDAVGDVGTVLWIVMGTIGVVLLIACANVANLLLVRAEGRRQELAVRVVLGAGRTRIARELLLESLVLGVTGGVIGLAVAHVTLRLLTWIGPVQLPRLDEISIDSTVLLFALTLSLLSGALFGLIPVLKYAAPQLSSALHAGGRTQTQGRERHRARSGLVVIQVALALVLLISAGLMIRSFQALRSVQPGFTNPGEVQTLRIFVPEGQVRDPEAVVRMQHAILEQIAGVPGVVSSSFAQSIPMDGRTGHDPIVAEHTTDADKVITRIRAYNFIAPGFFHTVGTSLIAGRDLTWTDVDNRRSVALVSENLARELWGEPAVAVGKRIREHLNSPWREVIGVVGDVRDEGIDKQAPTMVYFPIVLDSERPEKKTWVSRQIAFAVRSGRTGTDGFMEDIRRAVWAVNKDLPLADVRTLGEIYDRSMARTSFALVMLAIAGGMALLLGVVGIYAVISSSVAQRTREIGIRIALGARRSEVSALVLRQSVALTIVGIVSGLAGAAAVTGLLDGILFGVTPLDPATFLLVSLLLACIATLAAHIPAWRAARLDPMIALRQE
jgi:putative ABC transport system permease protein